MLDRLCGQRGERSDGHGLTNEADLRQVPGEWWASMPTSETGLRRLSVWKDMLQEGMESRGRR